MKQIVIAFDIDGTILNNETGGVNLEVVQLMALLKKRMKNTYIVVWSGGGSDYCRHICDKFSLRPYVDNMIGKKDFDEVWFGKVDIAFDDEHAFAMAEKNIIVRMK